MKRRNQIVLAIVGLLGLAAIGYAAAVVSSDPPKGKDAEADAIRAALSKVGLDQPTWQTIVVAASTETDVSTEELWQTWQALEDWPDWSQPLHLSARWLGEGGWHAGAEFEQVLDMGLMGELISNETVTAVTPGEEVLWCKDENGVRSCHLWRFESLPDGGSRVTNVEVLHGPTMGLVKPLMQDSLQQKFEASVHGLVAVAGQ